MTTLNQDSMKAKPDFGPTWRTPRWSVQRALARVWRLLLAPEALYHGITGTECSPGLNRNQMPKLYHILMEWLQDGLMLPFCCLMWGLGSYCRIKEGVVKQQNVVYFCRYFWDLLDIWVTVSTVKADCRHTGMSSVIQTWKWVRPGHVRQIGGKKIWKAKLSLRPSSHKLINPFSFIFVFLLLYIIVSMAFCLCLFLPLSISITFPFNTV